MISNKFSAKSMPQKHSVYIESLGCSKNLVDSENMLGLIDDHYLLSETPEEADILIVNTCSFIYDAQDESFDVIEGFGRLKDIGIAKHLIVTGCLAKSSADILLLDRKIDAILESLSFYRINEVIKFLLSKSTNTTTALPVLPSGSDIVKGKLIIKDPKGIAIPDSLPRVMTTNFYTAFIKISEGCDNRCSYCLIPSIKGRYSSRKIEDIVEEARDLAGMGVRELIVIAQDSSRYGMDIYPEPRLAQLLDALAAIDDLLWIRVHYMYPDILTDDVIETVFRHKNIVNYFDIPIQHGSDKILRLMNRKTSRADIVRIIESIRSHETPENPAVIRSTAIVGFPGENEDDFDQLCQLLQEIAIDRLGIFAYSDMERVPSFRFKGKLPSEIIEQRMDSAMMLQMGISAERLGRFVGSVCRCVVEEFSPDQNLYIGRTEFDSPEVDGEIYINSNKQLDIGDFVNVLVTESLEYDLIGDFYEYCE